MARSLPAALLRLPLILHAVSALPREAQRPRVSVLISLLSLPDVRIQLREILPRVLRYLLRTLLRISPIRI